ncbi:MULTISPECIES: YqaE/Pmp3 family membrane protein [Chryseobacterium]|jgi:TM2 domain-containing membrane protein YozV|uniref:YqaE/Pmp3 family membrane protein n=1 Tax=Chryseobacterium bernardetii TaxID=1241978 RepID=A0A3G6T151_9FLAO|nr:MULTISPECIES: YqaE/Pmp3 family membrane protein [Chryseobacterium]AZB23155.1 YqaE/Pmp3 family membrane protein [Chryseobacterium bernardetii]AZB33920.1 YqaE/Pmp3 family membrane protein [Chryseobacterium bernardetii]MBP2617971.1 TM2 domain-containing membrane protein YozV [Chryseobacterium jejuense]UCA61957.1 YqaE/Pmp3 family membrane protein [Chryseobacterium rhizoplanae]
MLLAIILPFLSFIVRGKILTGIICFILQITVIGWLPAAIWAVMSLNNDRANKRNEDLIRAVREGRK